MYSAGRYISLYTISISLALIPLLEEQVAAAPAFAASAGKTSVELLVVLLLELLRALVNEELNGIQNAIIDAVDLADRKERRRHQRHIQLEKLERIYILMKQMEKITDIPPEVGGDQSARVRRCRAVAIAEGETKAPPLPANQNHIIGGRILVRALADESETECCHRTGCLPVITRLSSLFV